MSSPKVAEQQGKILGSHRGTQDLEKEKEMDDARFRDGAGRFSRPTKPFFLASLPLTICLFIVYLSIWEILRVLSFL